MAKLVKTKCSNSTNYKIKKLENRILMSSMSFKCIRRQILLKLVVRPDLSSTIFCSRNLALRLRWVIPRWETSAMSERTPILRGE